jgi:hypothetical protein
MAVTKKSKWILLGQQLKTVNGLTYLYQARKGQSQRISAELTEESIPPMMVASH